jgi:PAS domain S-box-containing protein
MGLTRKTNAELIDENRRLRAHVAQLEDRLDHLAEHGAVAKALQQSEALHRDVMSMVSDTVFIADGAGRLAYVSPNAAFIFGHRPEDILRQGRISYVLPGDLFDPKVLQQRGEIANIEYEIRDAVGRARNLLVTVRSIDRHGGTTMYACRDVTERVKIELDYELLSLTLDRRVDERTRELRESRERYRRLVEGLRDEYLFYATDLVGTMTYVSPSAYSILGYTPEQVIGHNWREFIDANDPSLAELEAMDRIRVSGMPTPLIYAPIKSTNGEIRLMEFRDMPVRDADGRVIATEGIGKDVTQRHRAEEELRRAHEELEKRVQERTAQLISINEQLRDSEQRYRSVVEDQLEFIIRWHGDGELTFANAAYRAYCNASDDALIGTNFLQCMVEEDRAALHERLGNVSKDAPLVVHQGRFVLPDGRIAWHHWSHRALVDGKGNVTEYQSVGSDITERRKREEHLRDQAVAIGQMRTLSDRERDVMNLVVLGDANKVIARKLGLSIKTIEKHRSSLMKKLHIRSVPELVRLALIVDGPQRGPTRE